MSFGSPKPKPIPPQKPVTKEDVTTGFQKYRGAGSDFLSTIFTSAQGLKSGLKTKLGIGDK
jgi:hypothetical protein